MQRDLASFSNWCVSNLLPLNVDICPIIIFSLNKNPIIFDYFDIDGTTLSRRSSVVDLGFTFDSSVFSKHIRRVTNDAFRMLDIIKRNTMDFSSPYAIITLYKAFVRFKFEYA